MNPKTVWIIGLGVGVLAAAGLAAAWYLNMRANYNYAVTSILRPFSSTIDPTSGQLIPWAEGGNPPLSCPAGYTINIVAAYSDVIDPYGTCTSSPSPVLSFMCNPGTYSSGQCSSDGDCPAGMAGGDPIFVCGNVNSAGVGQCILSPVSSSAVCPAGTSLYSYGGKTYCTPTDMCSTGVPNAVCAPGGKGQCATRNGSSGVAKKCNGLQECNNLLPSDFGDYACVAPGYEPGVVIANYNPDGTPNWMVNGSSYRTGYRALPYTPGYSGGVPAFAGSGIAGAPSSNIGYSFHGIYTCE